MRVIPMQVTGGINQALKDMAFINEFSYQIGMCEKPEPINYSRQLAYAQSPVSQFAKSQLWKDQQVYPLPISDKHLKILF